MEYDELELDTLGDRKTALFIITSDTDSTFDFLSSMVAMQMMNPSLFLSVLLLLPFDFPT